MTHMLDDDFHFISYDFDTAVQKAAAAANLPDAGRDRPWYTEGGPAARQLGYRSGGMEETYIFDMAGMSLEDTADRFLLWAGIHPEGPSRLICVAPSFTRSFMDNLRARRGDTEIHFLYAVRGPEGFARFTDDMAAPDQPTDSALDKKLMGQKRPERPQGPGEARDLVERYLAKGLERDMSPPEARVEATRVAAWFSNFERGTGAQMEAGRAAMERAAEPSRVAYGIQVSGMEVFAFVDCEPLDGVSTLISRVDDGASLFLTVDASEATVGSDAPSFVSDWSPGAEETRPEWDGLLDEAARSAGVSVVRRPGWIFIP